MVTVFIPVVLRPFADGATTVEVAGATLREVVAALVREHPKLAGRVVDEGGIRPEVLIAVGSEEAFGLDMAVSPGAEVRILPAIAGGSLPPGIARRKQGVLCK